MNDRSTLISKLVSDIDTRTAYIRAKLGTLVPAQIRALRLKSDMPRQADLANEAKLHQSRISMFETPVAANVTLETLSRLAAAFQVGVVVKFVPFSEMLEWENGFSQDKFNVTKIAADAAFINPAIATASPRAMRAPRSWKMIYAGHGRLTPAYEGEIAMPAEQGVNGTATVQSYSPFSVATAQFEQLKEVV